MSRSLDKLVNNLEPDRFGNLKEQFNDIEGTIQTIQCHSMTLNCWCEEESFHMVGLALWKNCPKEIFH